MKKQIILVFIVILSVTFSSCSIAKKAVKKALEEEISSIVDEEDNSKDENKKEQKKKKDKKVEEDEAKEESSDSDEKDESSSAFFRDYTYEDAISNMYIIQENESGQSRLVDLEGNIIEDFSEYHYTYIDNTSLIMALKRGGDVYLYDMVTGEKKGPYGYAPDPRLYSEVSKSDVTLYSEGRRVGLVNSGKEITDAVYSFVDFVLDGWIACTESESGRHVLLDEKAEEVMSSDDEMMRNLGYGFVTVGFKPKVYLGNELLMDKTFCKVIALDENTLFAIDETSAYFFDREGNPLEEEYTTSNYHICDDIVNSMGNIVLINYNDNYGSYYTVLDKYGQLISSPYNNYMSDIILDNGDYCAIKEYKENTYHRAEYGELISSDTDKYEEANREMMDMVMSYVDYNVDEKTGEIDAYCTSSLRISDYQDVVGIEVYSLLSYFPDPTFDEIDGNLDEYSANIYVNVYDGCVYSLDDLFVDFDDNLPSIEQIILKKLEEFYELSREEVSNYTLGNDKVFKIIEYDGEANIRFHMVSRTKAKVKIPEIIVTVGLDELAPYIDTSHELFRIVK